MRTAAALKNEFVDHPAPPPPRVQILLHYTTPAKIDLGWKSRPNILSDVVVRNWRPHSVQLLPEAALRVLEEAKASHEAAVLKANASLLAGMQHLLAEEKRIKAMAAEQSAIARHPAATHPDRYVDAAMVAKKGSSIILVVCLFALFVYAATGFIIIHPYFAVLVTAACGVFYLMGAVLGRDVDKLD